MRQDAESMAGVCAMTDKIKINQRLAAVSSFLVLGLCAPAWAAGTAAAGVTTGFYGGVSLRDHTTESTGLQTASAPAAWTLYTSPLYTSPTIDEAATSTRALFYGGYRWRNDVAVEASFTSIDQYALRPADPAPTRRGVGLGVSDAALGYAEAPSHSWNLDLYTSWAFLKQFALYGRLGYAQAESAQPATGANLVTAIDPRRAREGVNYGVGLRYNLKSDLGLRLEYARFARFGIDTGSVMPDSDQVTFGVQYRF
jgi:opacity protein-like surface antigen